MTERIPEVDIVVIGAGPAGIAAAASAAEAGRSVLLVDEGIRPGGQIWRHRQETKLPRLARNWLERLRRSGAHQLRATVIDIDRERRITAESDGQFVNLNARSSVILAVGARERFLPFPGWTLPGVLGVGGAQAMLKAGLDVRGKRILLGGSGPLLLAVGAALARSGARIPLIAEQTPRTKLLRFAAGLVRTPARLIDAARYQITARTRYRTGVWVQRALGDQRVREAELTDGTREWTVPCDLLGVGYGLVPALELPRRLDCAITNGFVQVDPLQQTTVPGLYCAGETTGIAGVDAALVEGQIAGLAAAGAGARARALFRQRDQLGAFAQTLEQTFALRTELRALPEPDTTVCRCEDVSWARVHAYGSIREAKLMTRAGMGACQGRICGCALEFLNGWQADTVRSPVAPARIKTLAGG